MNFNYVHYLENASGFHFPSLKFIFFLYGNTVFIFQDGDTSSEGSIESTSSDDDDDDDDDSDDSDDDTSDSSSSSSEESSDDEN